MKTSPFSSPESYSHPVGHSEPKKGACSFFKGDQWSPLQCNTRTASQWRSLIDPFVAVLLGFAPFYTAQNFIKCTHFIQDDSQRRRLSFRERRQGLGWCHRNVPLLLNQAQVLDSAPSIGSPCALRGWASHHTREKCLKVFAGVWGCFFQKASPRKTRVPAPSHPTRERRQGLGGPCRQSAVPVP